VAEFVRLLRPTEKTRILDVGGYPQFWAGSGVRSQITVLNVHEVSVPDNMRGRCVTVVGDGTTLKYPDGEFDIVFSNSVIEHLSTWERQQRFAAEAQRVGKAYYVQTPAYEFFVEPHYITPFVHWLPEEWRRKLARNFTIWGIISRPSQQVVDATIKEIRLLRLPEFIKLFPEARIVRERVLGMTKSYAAVSL
jgi:hypothetical protein